MSLNHYRDEAGRFLEAIHAAGEPVEEKIAMLENELQIMKDNMRCDGTLKHQVYDLLFILFEIAAQYDIDLDTAWTAGMRRKESKYM